MSSTKPTRIDGQAPVISRQRLVVAAPIADVWRVHVDVANWPQWQRDISAASIDGPLAEGTRFEWRTAGIDDAIPSEVYAIEPERRTLWGGPAMGIVGIHEWRFTPQGQHTLVETEESWSGEPIDQARDKMQAALDGSLQRWLAFMAERATRR